MHMIWHQAIRPNLYLPSGTPFRHQVQVCSIISFAKKCLLPPVAPLRNVVRYTGHHYSRYSNHIYIILYYEHSFQANKFSMVSPEFSSKFSMVSPNSRIPNLVWCPRIPPEFPEFDSEFDC